MKKLYLTVVTEAPILNTADFQSVFGGPDKDQLKTDDTGHIRALELVAFKGMVFEVIEKTSCPYIYRVKCSFYPAKELYIDSRFTSKSNELLEKKLSLNLSSDEIIKGLVSLIGTDYIWGGNLSRGVANLFKYYPPKNLLLDKKLQDKWLLKGVDCSGFLFEITSGFTPRNTSELLNYKEALNIEYLTCSQIAKRVKPLDLIVFKGHVIIVIDSNNTIESRENFGVIKTPLLDVLNELIKTKKPVNKYISSDQFVIRRWYKK